jgi:hypothetical protein
LPVVSLLLAAGLWLTACGGEGDDDDGATRQETGTTADSHAVEALAERYFAALTAGDERTACATRARRDRLGLARTAGSCERAFRALMATTEFDLLRNAQVGTVTVRGDRASVSYDLPGDDLPGDDGPDSNLLAIKEGGRWGLIDEESLGERAEATDEQRPSGVRGRPCPTGTRLARAADLLEGLPPGYELAGAAETPPVVDFLRGALHGQLRRVETKVLVRGRSEMGTGVIVVNSRRRQSEQSFLADFVAGARAAGAARAERIDIAGSEGALFTAPSGIFATAMVGPCALVVLTDGDEARLRRTAALLHPPRR